MCIISISVKSRATVMESSERTPSRIRVPPESFKPMNEILLHFYKLNQKCCFIRLYKQ
jgi:hypothetical protein